MEGGYCIKIAELAHIADLAPSIMWAARRVLVRPRPRLAPLTEVGVAHTLWARLGGRCAGLEVSLNGFNQYTGWKR